MFLLRLLFTSLALLLFSCPAFADDAFAVRAVSGDEISLDDGRVVRLRNVRAASADAKDFLDSLVAGKTLILQDSSEDRYGRATALVFLKSGLKSVEDILLREGLAFVYPVSDDDIIDAFCDAEREARAAKRGFWADHKNTPAQDAASIAGTFGFVEGVVAKAERVKNKVFLSFGNPEKPDFTIVAAARFLRPLKKDGVDLLALEGRRVVARGWISRGNPPSLTLSNVHQIEADD